jgi:prepilin-type processing-associated H-X9-DG protein
MPRQGYYYAEEVICNDTNVPPIYPLDGEGPENLFTFMFNWDDMYPEYLPDFGVIVCPSDAGFTKDELINDVTGEPDLFRKCDEGDRGWNQGHGSYVYLSHAFDKADDDDPTAAFTSLGVYMTLFCADDDALPNVTVPPLSIQFGAWFDHVANCITVDQTACVINFNDDFDLEDTSGADGGTFNAFTLAGEFIGNGDTNTLFRLREGIERYLITDINNPGSSAESQSTLVLMFDQGSTFAEGFNHIPGGSNLLFLDGHVEFVKYPGRPPLNPASMYVTQCIQTGT